MIGLVACCKSKLATSARVRDLYTSPLFRLSLAYAESLCTSTYVCSAQRDLLELDQVVAPYDRTMASLTSMQRKLFGAAVARGLVDRHGSTFDLLILAGATYVDPIRMGLVRMNAPVTILEPLANLMIGERLSFLSRASSPSASSKEISNG